MNLKPICLRTILPAMLCLTISATCAEAQDAKQAALQLLDTAWEYNFSKIPQFEAEYARAHARFPLDGNLVKALAFAHLKYSRQGDALSDTASYRELNADDVDACRMQAWLALAEKDYPLALLAAEDLSKRLPPPEQKDPVAGQIDGVKNINPPQGGQPADSEVVYETERTAFTRAAYVRFLGAEFGYLMGPAENAIPQQQVKAVRATVLNELTQDDQKLFLEAEAAVEKQYTLLLLERDQLQDEEKAKEDQFKAMETQRLLQERQNVAAQREGLQAKEAQYAATRDAALADLDKERSEIEGSARELRAAADDLQRQIVAMELDIVRLLDLADSTGDPRLARRYRLEADSLARLQDARRFDRRNVGARLDAATAALRTVDAKRRSVMSQYQTATKQLKRDLGKLNARENRISLDLKKLAKASTGLSARVTNMTRRAKAIGTYVTLPLEAMKKRLVTELQAQ